MADKQLDLFRQFTCPHGATLDDMSNTLTFWDSLPKYQISREQQSMIAKDTASLPVIRHHIGLENVDYVMELQPAMIEQDGIDRPVYPGETEEIIEEVLRKFLVDQNMGYWDHAEETAAVSFSLEMISKELKKIKKKRSFKEIVQALEVLGRTVLAIKDGKRAICTGTLLTVTGVSRDDYLANPRSRWRATFHPFISSSIVNLKYRQINYVQMFKLRTPLARYFYRRLCSHYTHADYTNSYHFSYSSLLEDTQFFQAGRAGEHIKRINVALAELDALHIIQSFDTDIKRGDKRKILDAVFTVYGGMGIKEEAIAANQNDAKRMEQLFPQSTMETTAQRQLRYHAAD